MKKKITVSQFPFIRLFYYSNSGQDIERSIRYAVTGRLYKADNIPATKDADLYIYQIKSSEATVCKGIDVNKHIDNDKAEQYIYGSKQGIAYILTKTQYKDFVTLFARITTDSKGNITTRLKRENKAMIAWLEAITYQPTR